MTQVKEKSMSLKRDLVERFRALHKHKFNQDIKYQAAESKLKELAELVRTLASKQDGERYE